MIKANADALATYEAKYVKPNKRAEQSARAANPGQGQPSPNGQPFTRISRAAIGPKQLVFGRHAVPI
jgi:hypothetical protein